MSKKPTPAKAARSKPAPTTPPAPPPSPFSFETVDIASLKRHPRNYRTHPEDQLAHIAASIKQHGFYRNIVVAKDGTILAGHGVVEAAKGLGMTTVPVVRMSVGPNEPRALKLLAGDNEISRSAGIDDRALTELLKDIQGSDGLLGTGYDEKMLAALVMVTRPQSEIRDFDAAAEWVGMPDFNPGEKAYTLVISFLTAEDRDRFIQKAAMETPGRKSADGSVWSTWWPHREKNDLLSVRYEEQDGGEEAAS